MLGAGTPISELTAQVIEAKIGKHTWPSAKTHNNYMLALRGSSRSSTGEVLRVFHTSRPVSQTGIEIAARRPPRLGSGMAASE